MTAARPAVLRLVIAFLAAALLLLGGAAAAVAVSVPPRPESGAVRDQADILNPDQERELDQRIARHNRDNDHARVAVLTVEDTQGESIENFSRAVATAWGVGDKGKDNGVLVVADMGQRKLRIEVANGVREVLSDSDADDIMEEELSPGFKDGDYAGALDSTVDAIYEQATPEAAAAREKKDRTVAGVVIGAVALAVVGIVIWVVRWNRQEKARREQADREIERYQREHPDEEISDEVRKAYYRDRSTHKSPPDKPEKGKDEDGVEREMRYAPTFHAWFPLYAAYPALYNGQSSSGWGGSGAGTSFGGGGGFTGGGASGSF